MASSSSSTGVPPGFRFHPTDEELLLYYLKKKVSFDKFELEVIREVDLNKIEPWDLQERCRIGSAPQNEWYFFSHKDRKYPTGSRTNRATAAGFWKATGRDKCIRNTYSKIGMRKTLVFYRGRAPHGQKTDWIMHEYRLQDSADDGAATEDGWVVCRVFKKKCFFKIGGCGGCGGCGGGGCGGGGEGMTTSLVTMENQTSMEQTPSVLSSHYMIPNYYLHHNLYYSQIPASSYNSHGQVQDLLTNHRPASGYEFSVLPAEPGAVMKPYDVDGGIRGAGDGCELGAQSERNIPGHGEWAVLEGMGGRYNAAGAAPTQQMNLQMASQRGRSEMDLWGYGK